MLPLSGRSGVSERSLEDDVDIFSGMSVLLCRVVMELCYVYGCLKAGCASGKRFAK